MAGLKDVRDVLRGAIASVFGFGGRMIARAVLMIIAGRSFGSEALGVLGQVAAITEIAAMIAVMGLKRGLLDILSYEETAGRAVEAKILEALSAAMLLSLVISTITLILWYEFVPEQFSLAPLLFLGIPALVFIEIALTAIKHKRIIGWDVWSRAVAEPWAFLLLTIIFLQLGMLQHGLIIAYLSSIAVAFIVVAIGFTRTYTLKNLMSARPQRSNWVDVMKKSAPVAVTDIGYMALRRLDLLVLGRFVSPEAVGIYYMVQQLATVPQKTYGLFEPMLSPVIASLHHKVEIRKIRSSLIGVCRWIFIIQIAITIPMIVYGDALLSVFGREFAMGAAVLTIILFAELVDGTFMPTETVLLFNRPKIPPILFVIALVIEVIAIAILSSQFGLIGAGMGFFIAVAFLAIGRLGMIQKHMGFGLINKDYIKPALLAVVTISLMVGLRQTFQIQNGLLIIILFIFSIGFFLGSIRLVALTKTDQVLLRALGQKRRKNRATSNK